MPLLGLGASLFVSALLMSAAFSRFKSRGVWLAAIGIIGIGMLPLLAWRSGGTGGETPLSIDVGVVLITAIVVAQVINVAGARGQTMLPRALTATVGGMLAFIAASFLGYVGWVWLG